MKMKKDEREKSKEIVEDIHEIINELKSAEAPAIDSAAVARGVFRAIATSCDDPYVRAAAINGIWKIEEIMVNS